MVWQRKSRKKRQWNLSKNSSQYFWRKTSLNISMDPDYQIIRPARDFNSTISIPPFQCRIRVDSVLTQNSSKSRIFSIATFGGLNQACRYGDRWVWWKKFFIILSYFGILWLSGVRQKERIHEHILISQPQKTNDWDPAARCQVIGYGGLVVEIDKNVSKLLAIVWQSWTNNIPIQRTKSVLSAGKLLWKPEIYRFRQPWKKLDW